jgi:hypothetical protein
VKSLATARKSFKKFQEIVKKVYGDKALKRMQIQAIIKKLRRGNRQWQQQIRGTSMQRLLSPMSRTSGEDWRESVSKLT